jgi:Bifunctional DNA primase/polymerase, N-terminal
VIRNSFRSGVTTVDIDLGAKSWWGENRWQIPATQTHRTRSGGLHLFFVHEPGLRNTCSRIAPGVDTRADGGSIIWWPAIGLPVICSVPPASWPAWLLDAQKPPAREAREFEPTTDRYARAALRNAAELVAKAGEGTRNHTLNAQTYALSRFQNLSAEEITELMLQAASACGLPPIEAQRTVASALKRSSA